MILRLPETPELRSVRRAAEIIRGSGREVMLVGGAVRDLLNCRRPSDYDLVTTARPDELAALFPDYLLAGKSFGVGLLKLDGMTFEIATARLEREYMDGRHPTEIKFADDLADDVVRRDFTINALLCDPLTGAVVDHVGGVEDCFRGVIRTVGEPLRRFREDYLRMLRAVRFASRFDFGLMPDVERAIEELAPLASQLAAERVREELSMMLLGKHPGDAFRLLKRVGLLAAVLPEIDRLSGVEQPPEFHPEGDVFSHTMLMLDSMACPELRTAWSALLHDVGKPDTFSREPGGRIRFFGHESAGADIAAAIMERLRFSRDDAETIKKAIRDHMRFASVCQMREGKVRRMIAEPGFPVELELHRLDCRCSHSEMEVFIHLLDRLGEEPKPSVLPAPLVGGNDLIAAGLKPSPLFRQLLEECFDRQLAGEFADREAALKFALDFARESETRQ